MQTKYLLIVLVALVCFNANATVINIPSDFPTIQEGIDSSLNGDTVLVQPGTYIENINFNGHNIVLGSLFLTTGDTSYISQTIIDGDSAGSVVTFANNESSTTILAGFTIQNGYAENGGGTYCANATPTIHSNIILNNRATYGGGIYGSCIVEFCKIEKNSATNGGGIYNCYIVRNTDIILNSANYGGGIYGGNFPQLHLCKIRQNGANFDGGAFHGDIIEIDSCIVTDNTAGNNGGGLYGLGSVLQYSISYSLFADNQANGDGGAVYFYDEWDGDLFSSNSTFTGNVAGGSGGAVYVNYGGMTLTNFASDLFWQNHAPLGNDIYPGGFFYYCNIEGGSPDDGNIYCSPLFCDPDSDNYYLAENSCCVGAGAPWTGPDIGAYGVGCSAIIYEYLPGDANMYNGIWPPELIGSDVTYLVNYFRGAAEPCLLEDFYCSPDVNGDCQVVGSDVTRLVSYFRQLGELSFCPDYPPAWLTSDDCPELPPEGWPGCEEQE